MFVSNKAGVLSEPRRGKNPLDAEKPGRRRPKPRPPLVKRDERTGYQDDGKSGRAGGQSKTESAFLESGSMASLVTESK